MANSKDKAKQMLSQDKTSQRPKTGKEREQEVFKSRQMPTQGKTDANARQVPKQEPRQGASQGPSQHNGQNKTMDKANGK
jgi:hypothetical protein